MNSSLALSSATFIYALASVFYIGSFAFKKQVFAKAGFIVLAFLIFTANYWHRVLNH